MVTYWSSGHLVMLVIEKQQYHVQFMLLVASGTINNMRFTSALLLLLTQDARSLPESNVSSRRLNTEFSCFGDHNFDLYFKGKCTYNELVARMDVMVQENLSACPHTAAEEVMFLLGKLLHLCPK